MLRRSLWLGLATLALIPAARANEPRFEAGFASITAAEVERDVRTLAAPEMEGRDSPSAGLNLAATYIEERMRAAGLVGAGPEGSFRLPFLLDRQEPDPKLCRLEADLVGAETREFELGEDFVPLPGCEGVAEGELVFAGFAIASRKDRYDDLSGLALKGKVVLFLQGEPEHPKLFDGPEEVTGFADVYGKLDDLADAGAVGALMVRRPAETADAGSGELGFRYTWARWNAATTAPMKARSREAELPALEISAELALRLLGQDVLAVAQAIERAGKPQRIEVPPVRLTLSSASRRARVPVANIVGKIPGTDPELADEYIVLGAHYDHIGVDVYGRIGFGADDNASGTSAMIEAAEALGLARPRRSVLACAFAAEEDGLLGSTAFVREPPVDREKLVCMLNLDMVGHGDPASVVVLGPKYSSDLSKALKAAKKLEDTGLKRVLTNKAEHLWERSDHYPFFRRGIPSLFFFESPSEADNPHYHTYRDTVDIVSFEKVTRTARLVFSTAWIVGNAEDAPAVSRR